MQSYVETSILEISCGKRDEDKGPHTHLSASLWLNYQNYLVLVDSIILNHFFVQGPRAAKQIAATNLLSNLLFLVSSSLYCVNIYSWMVSHTSVDRDSQLPSPREAQP